MLTQVNVLILEMLCMKIFLSLCFMLIFLADVSVAQNELSGFVTEAQIREIRIFDLYTKRYKPNMEAIAQLNTVQDSVLVDVFLGTWCHDSKREIPAFFKVMEEIDNPNINARYTALEYRRRGPMDVINKNNIKRTPTFIVYKNGKEIGRIIEEVQKSVEEDLLNIVKGI